MKPYRLERHIFKAQSYSASTYTRSYWMKKAPAERLQAAWYLTCSAYNIDFEAPIPLNKTVFSKRKQNK